MKRFILHISLLISTTAIVITGCVSLDAEKQYEATRHKLSVKAVYPEEFKEYARAGVTISAINNTNGSAYTALTDENSSAEFMLSEGFYNVSLSDVQGIHIFNGASDQVPVAGGDQSISLQIIESHSSSLVIKEIYSGGCTKYPEEGTYQYDKYVILHNNGEETYYLDGLCFGMVEPYNSTATSVWITYDPQTGEAIFPDYLPIVECIWQFGGNGEDLPLSPGEDAVIAVNGAIDHTLQYPNSVNLNDERYFVCYNIVYYPNTLYHPAPGEKIPASHYLNIVEGSKVSTSNAYPLSISSPTAIIFRAQDCDIAEFVAREGTIVTKPGSSVVKILKIPVSWTIDAVEVYNGSSSNNNKRLPPSIDAGFVYQSGTYLGHSIHRRLDEESSNKSGYDIYVDTNNSTNDFYERERPSLKDNE